jgi:hypothetical protein
VPYGLPGSEDVVVQNEPVRPSFRRERPNDAFNDFTRALFDF